MNTTRRVALTVALLVLCGTLGFAQMFPQEETLDVVYTTDGSVLRGRIVADVPDEYLTIEIYGGSAFVVAYANVERVRKEPNPDYGTEWITARVGQSERAEDAVAARLSGHIAGVYLGPSWVRFGGSDWDRVEENSQASLDDPAAMHITGGIAYTFLGAFGDRRSPGVSWGIRVGLGYAEKSYTNEIANPYGLNDWGDYVFTARTIEVPTDLLLGYGTSRFMAYVAGGTGMSILLGEPKSEYGGDDVGHPSGEVVKNSVLPLFRASVGGYLRLTEVWTGEVRGYVESSHTNNWYGYDDFRMHIDTVGVTVGIGRHIR
jgi:hypothetical protein